MNPLAGSWIAFLIAWKILPARYDDLTAADIALSIALVLSLFMILHPSKSKEYKPVLFVLPFFAAAFVARANLGDNWGVPNERVETGLYAVFDHPIYLALFVAAVVSAFFSRAPYSIVGLGLLGATFTTAAYLDDAKLTELGQ